jgi:hypothetical protein
LQGGGGRIGVCVVPEEAEVEFKFSAIHGRLLGERCRIGGDVVRIAGGAGERDSEFIYLDQLEAGTL